MTVFVTVSLRFLCLNNCWYDWLIMWMCLYCVFPAWSRQCAEEGPASADTEAGRVRESPLLHQSSGGGTDRIGGRKTAGEETQTGGGGSAEGQTQMQHTAHSLTQPLLYSRFDDCEMDGYCIAHFTVIISKYVLGSDLIKVVMQLMWCFRSVKVSWLFWK